MIRLFNDLSLQSNETVENQEKIKAQEYHRNLKYKIEDNIDQLTKTRIWKNFEEKMINSQNDTFAEYVSLLGKLNHCKFLGTQSKTIHSLETISKSYQVSFISFVLQL